MPIQNRANPTRSITDIVGRPHEIQDMIDDAIAWFSSHAVQIVIAVGIGIAIYLALTLAKRTVCHLRERAGASTDLTALIGRTANRTTHFFMMMAAARLVVGYANPPALLLRTVIFLFTIAAVFQAALWVREFVLGLIERRTRDENEHGETLSNAMGLIRICVTFALFAIAAIMVLDNLGVNVTGLVAGLGIGGIAIGLAAQGIFSDLFAALSIIFDQPFRQGDTIQYDQTVATVERIGLKSTRLRSINGEAKVISNANLLQKEITNYRDIARRRYELPFSIIFQTPAEKVARIPAILKEIVQSCGGEFQRAAFLRFGTTGIDFELSFYFNGADVDRAVAVRHKIGAAILERFAEEGLIFAGPAPPPAPPHAG